MPVVWVLSNQGLPVWLKNIVYQIFLFCHPSLSLSIFKLLKCLLTVPLFLDLGNIIWVKTRWGVAQADGLPWWRAGRGDVWPEVFARASGLGFVFAPAGGPPLSRPCLHLLPSWITARYWDDHGVPGPGTFLLAEPWFCSATEGPGAS